MNLMFWKKKTGAAEEAGNAPENLAVNSKVPKTLDFVAATRNTAERNPKPSETEAPDIVEAAQETTSKPGWSAWIKLQIGNLTQRFKKAPAFRADVEPNTRSSPEEPDDFAPTATEAPDRPGLAIRLKMQLAALLQRFRKTPAADTNEDDEKKSSIGRSEVAPKDELEGEAEIVPTHTRKRLVIGGAIGLLALLLAGIVIVYWPVSEPPPQPLDKHDTASIASHPAATEPASDESQASAPKEPLSETEALKKENAELQARIEALEKVQPPAAPPAWQPGGKGAYAPSASGEVTLGSENPQSAAMSLKEAIEAMNASSGGYNNKPAK
jgi:hypothetical protein